LLAPRKQVYHTPYFALPWLLPARSLVTVHDCIFERDARYMPKRWARSYYRLLMMVSLRRAHTVFMPSRATASDVRRFYRVPSRKLVVTPEAADTAFHPIQDKARLDEVRQRYGLQSTFVLAVGMRRPHKNFGLLVQAFGLAVEKDNAEAQLAFVGEADERFHDEAADSASALGDRVRFLGKVPEADLPVLYNLAAAFACPSLIEGFGLPVLEAMSCGTPVICSDIPVLREVAGDAALRVPPTDARAWAAAIQQVCSRPELRASLSQAGLKRSAHFTWQRCAVSVLPTYRRLNLF
jgi:glycosyltransferase involved in cell wall biosynthesis